MSVSFGGKLNMTMGMVCYKSNLKDDTINELHNMGMDDARGNNTKLDGKVVLDTKNITQITDMGIGYYLPKCDKEVFLRFNDMKLKQADYDSFLIAYNAAKDTDVQINVNV